MQAELARVKAWLNVRTARPRPRTPLSQFLLSSCCNAPVVQHDERFPDLVLVLCSQCDTELGAPGREDVEAYEPSWLGPCGWGARHGRHCFGPHVTIGFDAASSDERHMVWLVTTPDEPSRIQEVWERLHRGNRGPHSGAVEIHTETTRWWNAG